MERFGRAPNNHSRSMGVYIFILLAVLMVKVPTLI
jgi:hypothetical protein